jgi:hypothetical protein
MVAVVLLPPTWEQQIHLKVGHTKTELLFFLLVVRRMDRNFRKNNSSGTRRTGRGEEKIMTQLSGVGTQEDGK